MQDLRIPPNLRSVGRVIDVRRQHPRHATYYLLIQPHARGTSDALEEKHHFFVVTYPADKALLEVRIVV